MQGRYSPPASSGTGMAVAGPAPSAMTRAKAPAVERTPAIVEVTRRVPAPPAVPVVLLVVFSCIGFSWW